MELPQSPNYASNYRRVRDGQNPCAVCGKGVSRPRYYVHIVGGGGMVATEAEIAEGRKAGDWAFQENADLYFYPIGSDCLRRHPELKPYAQEIHDDGFPEPTTSVPGFGSITI